MAGKAGRQRRDRCPGRASRRKSGYHPGLQASRAGCAAVSGMRSNSAPDIVIAPAEGSKHGRMQRQARLRANRLHVKKSHLRECGVQRCRLRRLHSAYFFDLRLLLEAANPLKILASPTGFEPVTPRLGIWCSILLSYEDTQSIRAPFRKRSTVEWLKPTAKELQSPPRPPSAPHTSVSGGRSSNRAYPTNFRRGSGNRAGAAFRSRLALERAPAAVL